MTSQTRTNLHHSAARSGHRIQPDGTAARTHATVQPAADLNEPGRPFTELFTRADAPGQDDAAARQPKQHGTGTVATATMLTVPEAARLLVIGRTLAYDLVRTGTWPTPILRIGRLVKIPSGPLQELLATGHIRT